MNNNKFLNWVAAGILGICVCLGTMIITTDQVTKKLTAEHNEQLAKATNDAFVQGICRTSGNPIGTCEATVVASGREYLIQGGVVLQDNGELQATPALLPAECTGNGSEDRQVNEFANDPEPVCTVSFPEATAVPANE